ncbi:MAG: hypothetical protein ACFHVJ_19180 [Aestuariibacter sp.]
MMNKELGFFGGISTGLFFGAFVGDFLLGGMTGLVLAIAMQAVMAASDH